ncbi:MAG TPA: ABC transporter substrate-binding protein [Bacteroidales bacterium]|nr:ABC transporter substrate-binding protein [Bacteroidales bacterium]
MKLNRKLLTVLVALLILPLSFLKGQDEKINYGKAPDEIFPFDKFTKAHEYFFLKPIECYSAGREIPPPKNLKEVRIGFLGPLDGSMIIDLGTQMLHGCEMAIDEANAKGGYHGIPFKLMVHNDVGLWGAAANEVVSMDDEGVWAWLGSIDDIVSHVALRATLKMEIPEVCTGDPDPTFTETNIPWMIRVISDDRQSAYALAHQIFTMDKHSRVAVIRTGSRYGRVAVKIFSETAVRMGHPMIIEERFADGESDFKPQLERIKKVDPDAILIWGNARESALILNQIRELGITQPVYGSDRMVSAKFLEMAGKNAEGIVTTCQYNPDSDNPRLKAFQANYMKKYGEEPEVFAAHAYDGMNIIIEAIRKAGLNRVLIRDLLTDQKTFQGYQGITGKIVLDGSWNDIGDIYLAEVKNGKFKFTLAPPPKDIDKFTSSTAGY